MKLFFFLFTCILFVFPGMAEGQSRVRDSVIAVPVLSASVALQWPGNDLAKRFYMNANVGGSFFYKTKKNWLWGGGGSFLFRESVKEKDILKGISTVDGYIIGSDGTYAEVYLQERGFNIFLSAGKIFPWKKIAPNPNSGLIYQTGIGLLQHKIRIDNPGKTVPQISREYRKGYDRLSNGMSWTNFAGYYFMGNRRLINFYAGIEITAAITENRRSVNFDTRTHDNTRRMDTLYGIRFGWMIPFYRRQTEGY